MRITVEPTPELFNPKINGVVVPTRVWVGVTDKGTEIEAYVLSIVPKASDNESSDRLRKELPSFMQPSRNAFHIEVENEDK